MRRDSEKFLQFFYERKIERISPGPKYFNFEKQKKIYSIFYCYFTHMSTTPQSLRYCTVVYPYIVLLLILPIKKYSLYTQTFFPRLTKFDFYCYTYFTKNNKKKLNFALIAH